MFLYSLRYGTQPQESRTRHRKTPPYEGEGVSFWWFLAQDIQDTIGDLIGAGGSGKTTNTIGQGLGTVGV